jgi:hypothetical protein
MNFTITESVFITQIKTMFNQPVSIMNGLCCPLGTRMVTESTLLGAVRSVVCFEKGSIVVIPLGGNDRKHLAALQGHLDNVLVRKTESTLCRKFTCYEDVHPNVESGSRAI